MAHNIHFNQDLSTHSFFSVKQKAWHGLGQILENHPSSAEAIRAAGLDYPVIKAPLFTRHGSTRIDHHVAESADREIKVPGFFATLRADTSQPLGVVGRDYHIMQNKDAFTFFDQIAASAGVRYETAGALGNGERIFITAKLPGHMVVGRDDLIEKYLFLTNSHDGSGSITAAFTPVRIVCQNTLNAAFENQVSAVKIRHTAGAKERLVQARQVMGLAERLTQQAEGVFNRWAKVRITDQELKRLIERAMAPNKEVLGSLKDGRIADLSAQYLNLVEDVYAYALSSPSQNLDTTAGTVFGAYNAVTGYFQNVRSYKDDQAKIKSVLFGGTAQLRGQSAFGLCEGFARHGAGLFQMN